MLISYYKTYRSCTHSTRTSVKHKGVSTFDLKGQIWEEEKPFGLTTIFKKKLWFSLIFKLIPKDIQEFTECEG